MVVLPNKDLKAVEKIAEMIQNELTQKRIIHEENAPHNIVTVSMVF